MKTKSNVEIHPTLIIGLGGTGHDVLLDLKRRLTDQFDEVPPIIHFLAFDTAEPTKRFVEGANGQPVELELNKERFLLRVEDPNSIIGPHNPHIEEWWPHGTLVSQIISGATQIRARGRLALFANYIEVKNLITKSLTEVRKVDNIDLMRSSDFFVSQTPNTQVYVVSSLAGGTGSGMFLDIAFITRHLLFSSSLVGVFVMPRVFSHLPGTHFTGPNSYAALKEIEYFSKLRDTDRVQIDYGANKVKVKRPPFDLIYLIDSLNEQERIIDDPSLLFSRVAQGIHVQIGSEVGVSNRNVMDNILGNLDSAGIVENRSVRYCSFGVSSCTWAHREFTNVIEQKKSALAQQLIDNLVSDVAYTSSYKSDADRFMRGLGLTAERIEEFGTRLTDQGDQRQLTFEMSLSSLAFNNEAANNIRDLAGRFVDKAKEKISTSIRVNFPLIEAELQEAVSNWKLERPLEGGVFQYALGSLAHAAETANQLDSKVSKDLQQCKNRLDKLEKQDLKEKEDMMNRATQAYFRRRKKMEDACKEYAGAIELQCRLMLKHEQLSRTNDLIHLFLTQVKNLHDWYEAAKVKLKEVTRNLELISSGNRQTPKANQTSEPFERILEVMPTIPQIRIDPAFFINSCRQKFQSFAGFLKQTGAEMVEHILQFIHESFGISVHTSIDDIVALATTNGRKLNFSYMSHLAAPLWRFNINEIPLKRRTVNRLAYCSVKSGKALTLKDSTGGWFSGIEPEFIAAADDYHITFFNVTEGVPLFALHGIREMEAEYHELGNSACHLRRDWMNLPDVVPKYIGSNVCCFAVAQADSFGLIKEDDNGFVIHLDDMDPSSSVPLGQTCDTAYAEFEKREDIVKRVKAAVSRILDKKSWKPLKEGLYKHIDQLASRISNGSTPAENEFVQAQIKAMNEYLSENGI
jgi:hypothetical protein